MREHQTQNGAKAKKVLYFEGVDVRVVRRLIVMKHEVDDIRGRSDKQNLKSCVIEGVGEGPEKIWFLLEVAQNSRGVVLVVLDILLTKVASDKHHQVQGLRFE